MTEQEIKDNMLIHEWMSNERTEKETGEATYNQGEKGCVIWASQLQYHASWDWLMPVARKFFDIKDMEDFLTMRLTDEYARFDSRIKAGLMAVDIRHTYLNLTEAIKWDNNRKK